MPRGVKKVVEESVEEIKVEQEVASEVAEEPAVEASEEAVAAEEPVAVEEAPAVEETPVVEEAPAAEEVAAEEPVVESEDKSTTTEVAATEGEWTFVDHLRIYPNNADRNIRTSVITGNIRVIGEQDGFKKIQYLKHGFGIVEALTDALN